MKSKTILLITISLLSYFPQNTYALFGDDSKKSETKNLLEYENNTINVFEKAVKSVVNVSNIRIAKRGSFFDFDVMEVPAGAGSGFVWDKNGHIVTNYHVVANADSFLISFHKDQKQYKAKLVGVEPKKDIAVLKLEEMPKEIFPIEKGYSSKLRVGQKAMALGNPFGLDNTITAGIISALGRKIKGIGGVKIHNMIQADTSINPGNSGGPLLDSSGRVIGVNTMIFSNSGSSAGVGFAVPIDTVKTIVPMLIKHGKVKRPGLGIGLAEDSVKYYFGIKKGIIVKFVDPKSNASKAGIEGMTRDGYGRYSLGDIIIKVGETEVDNYDDIYHALEKYDVGEEVMVVYLRNNKKRAVKIKLIEL